MAHRIFSDASGREWLVWDVYPAASAERENEANSTDIEVPLGTNRGDPSRWTNHLPSAYAGGWLCFENGEDRRRLAPIPSDWLTVPDAKLAELVEHARRVGQPRDARLDTSKLRAMSRPSGEQRVT